MLARMLFGACTAMVVFAAMYATVLGHVLDALARVAL